MTEAGKVAIVVALIGAAGAIAGKLLDLWGSDKPRPAVAIETAGVATGPAPRAISGAWTDKDGDMLTIEQRGASFTVPRWSFDGYLGGDGKIDGRTVTLDYRTTSTKGQCTGTLAADGRAIDLVCVEPGNRFNQRLSLAG